MIKLVKNEIYKLFHKKSTIITLIVLTLFVILTNVIYKNFGVGESYYNTYDSTYMEMLEESINNFGEITDNNSFDYIHLKSEYDAQKFGLENETPWKNDVYVEMISPYVYEYYNNLYGMKNESDAKRIKEHIDLLLGHLEDNDWEYFVKERIDDIDKELKSLDKESDEGKRQIEILEYQKYLLDYRLKENISYEPHFLNTAINSLNDLVASKISYEEAKTDKEKARYQEEYAEFKENEYILEEKVDIKNETSNYGVLRYFFDEYLFLILVFVIMIAGAMVSNEFSKGTVKSLLVMPYKRSQILMAKFITVILMILFVTLFLLGVQLVVGSLVLGHNYLGTPVVKYNLKLEKLEMVNIFGYVGLCFLGKLSLIVLLATLAFSLSVLLCSTSFAITITFFGFFGSEIINNFALMKDMPWLDYFVTTNWDMTYFLFGGSSPFEISLGQSIVTCLVYFGIMMVVSLIIFKRKNIKNI